MGSSSKGLSSSVTAGEQANSNALVGIAQGQANNANQLFQMAFPGMQQSENFAQTLSTGDPYAIAKATAPATQQISQATAGAKQNIMNNAPAGGEKNLALEQADVQQGSQVGSVASQGYLNSFNTLAQLGGAGVGLSNSASSGATSAYGASSQTLSNLGNQQVEQKGASLGALGSLAGAAASAGTGFLQFGCWIAAELYDGWDDPRTIDVRQWIFTEFIKRPIGKIVCALYMRFGERTAQAIHRRRALRPPFQWLFNLALAKARAGR